MNQAAPASPHRPSRKWYLLASVIFVASFGVFAGTLVYKSSAVAERIESMPRLVGPTPGTVVELDEPGQYVVYHENLGTFEGQSFDTPRRQVWPTLASPAMTCDVTEVASGRAVEVRLPGVTDVPKDKSEVNTDLVPAYDRAGRQGHGVWVFNIDQPGEYRITLEYVPEVALAIEDVEVAPPLTRDMQAQMRAEEGKAYEENRRAAEEMRELARLEPVDVLIAVGRDPSRGSFFEVFGLKGAATVFAFGFVASAIIALVTFMLRNGHVTRRGELDQVQRGIGGMTQSDPASR
jgi:hypothetical protein